MTEPNFEMLHGRTNKKLITLPESWEEDVDMSTVTVHLTQVGANQDLRVKRHQGREVHLDTNGLPVDCYYLIMGELLDKDDQTPYNKQVTNKAHARRVPDQHRC